MASAQAYSSPARLSSCGVSIVVSELNRKSAAPVQLLGSSNSSLRKGLSSGELFAHNWSVDTRQRDGLSRLAVTAVSAPVKGVGRTRPTSDPAAPEFLPIPPFQECFPSSTKETR